MQQLIATAKQVYQEKYRTEPQFITAAPGRVNLIGEHTDYNGGFVFPMAIERYTVIAAGTAPDLSSTGTARIFSTSKNESVTVNINGTAQPADKTVWSSYVQGTLQMCIDELSGSRVLPLTEFNAVIHSNVPLGGGLSSSASLEIATATVVEALTGIRMNPVKKALLCQKAEHTYANMPCGIMDQYISTLGEKGKIMLLDCRSRTPRMVPFDDPDVAVLIVNSNVKHTLTGSEYPDRRRQCEQAAQLLGVPVLRDATADLLESKRDFFNGDVSYRRAKHVITENDRTVKAADALSQRDYKTAGQLMYESHASMKNDFEITVSEIDTLVEIASALDGVFGSRMTGGGFGGCTVSLIASGKADTIMKAIAEQYKAKTGIDAALFITGAAQGVKIL